MWTVNEMKERGKAACTGNYWYCVLVSVILGVCAGGAGGSSASQYSDPEKSEQMKEMISSFDPAAIAVLISILGVATIIGIVVAVFLFNPLKVGCQAFFSRNVRNTPASLNEIKAGFDNYMQKVGAMFLKDLYIFLWYLLFIIPGFIKTYSYRMVPYILADNPGISANEAITRSRKMMNGNKWKAFCLDLSFFGWIVLALLTCGILAIFWTNPYMLSTQAALYEELKAQEEHVVTNPEIQ
ncbi:MAG: DUF975 family protein [Lachnospiraceae bacterium]|nr:DUF975 family protein [Lachnospiraceae bacterium]